MYANIAIHPLIIFIFHLLTNHSSQQRSRVCLTLAEDAGCYEISRQTIKILQGKTVNKMQVKDGKTRSY